MLPRKLQKKLEDRSSDNALRSLGKASDSVDFSSNDYLGFSTSELIFNRASEILKHHHLQVNGATGSRLLSGNHSLFQLAEDKIAQFHNSESALIFNSGYDANLGFFSSVPQRGDFILYDELCHASIRDGIQMSHAKSYKFRHNNLEHLSSICQVERPPAERAGSRNLNQNSEIYIVTESTFSMDGDQPDLKGLVALCKKYNCHLVVDEAHALGVVGEHGEGLVQQLGIETEVFTRIITFGKGLGCHGAAILGRPELKQYLVNFARSFIYTTGLPPHSIATILAAYEQLEKDTAHITKLKNNIGYLQETLRTEGLQSQFLPSDSAIHCCLVSGNTETKHLATQLQKQGFDVKPILSPTVPEGQERLRVCVHSFNTKEQIEKLTHFLKNNLEITQDK
tara:strand:+ start:608994 stop:610181 length:1188 start_codon:yes stop_codon:yes gene_type:complete